MLKLQHVHNAPGGPGKMIREVLCHEDLKVLHFQCTSDNRAAVLTTFKSLIARLCCAKNSFSGAKKTLWTSYFMGSPQLDLVFPSNPGPLRFIL